MKKRKYTAEEIDTAYSNKQQYDYVMSKRNFEKAIKSISEGINKEGKTAEEIHSIAVRLYNEQLDESIDKEIAAENSKWYKKLWNKIYDWLDNDAVMFIAIAIAVILFPISIPIAIIGLIIWQIIDNHNHKKEHYKIMENFLDFDLSTLESNDLA